MTTLLLIICRTNRVRRIIGRTASAWFTFEPGADDLHEVLEHFRTHGDVTDAEKQQTQIADDPAAFV